MISVDPVARTADVQGMCTYEDLVDATLPHGLIPLVVPQLRTITLGGAVTGLGIESTSFRNGLPHESVLEMDVFTGAGEVVTATPDNEHADLFATFPNSYGSLGYATRLRIELEPVRSHVALRHVRFTRHAVPCRTRSPTVTETREWHGERVDAIDGTAFEPGEYYLTLGALDRRASRPPGIRLRRASRSTGARSSSARPTCSPPTTTSGAGTPTGSGARARSAPSTRSCAGSGPGGCGARTPTTGWSASTAASASWTGSTAGPAGRGASAWSRTSRCPVERLGEFLDWFDARGRHAPGVAVPAARLFRDETAAWPSYPLMPGRTYVNVGFWGAVPVGDDAPNSPLNRAIEDKVSELEGHKSLYSESFYDPRDLRPALRRRQPGCREEALRPRRPADQPLRQGGATTMTQIKDQTTTLASTRLTLAEMFESLLAGPAPIRFTAYDGSTYGPEDAEVGLDLKNERGLAYLVTAPGDLGMARAYVVRRPRPARHPPG